MNRIRANGLLLLGVGLAGLVVWQLRPRPPLPGPVPPRSDYVLRNFELVSLDEQGREAFTVQAPYLERDPGGKSLSLRQPRFSFPDQGGDGRWLAGAESAWVAEKGVEVRLIDKVQMIGPPSESGVRTRIATEHLQVFPKQNLARSDDAVTIRRADSILSGTGLRADMSAHRIQLLADVKGRYAPRP